MNEFVIDERGNCSVCGGTHYGSSRRQCPLKSEMSIEENTAKPAVKPPRLVVIDRTMLVSAIACNTDASPPEAASIVNTVLYKQKQTSTDPYDIHNGMYVDRCDDNIGLCNALITIYSIAG